MSEEEGKRIREELLEAGVIVEGDGLSPFEVPEGRARCRLDEQGRAIARREIKRGKRKKKRLPNGYAIKAI